MAIKFLALVIWFYLIASIVAQTATISIGDLHQYIPPATTQAVPNGTTIRYSGDDSEGVNTINESCFQSVRNVLTNPQTDVQARAVSAYAVFAVLQAIGATVAFILALALVDKTQSVPAYISIPPYQVSQASSGANASVTVFSAANTTPFTITPMPYPTTVTGSITPAVTTYTTATDGHTQGDVLISLSSDLAARMSDFIHISANCPSGNALDSTTAKRDIDFGNILCGSEGLILNSVPGGPFADFRLVNIQPLPFTNAGAIRAMNAAMSFARTFAPNLQLDPDQAALLGVAAFAISWALWNSGQPLSSTNVIPAAALAGTITTPPSASSTSTETCSVCLASCGFVGPVQVCSTECSETSACTSSPATGIWGVNDGGEEVSTTTTVAYTDYGPFKRTAYTSNITSITPTTVPFYPGGPVSLSTPASITTIPTSTPSPSPSSSPPPAPSLGPQNCNGADDYGNNHPDISEDEVTWWINQIICKNDETFDASTPPLDWNPTTIKGFKDHYHYRISWISGCETTVTSQQKLNPFAGINDITDVTCYSLLYEDYKNCINGGVGGWRDVGCLRYEQNPSTA